MVAKRLALAAVLIGGFGAAAGGVALANGGYNAAARAQTGSAPAPSVSTSETSASSPGSSGAQGRQGPATPRRGWQGQAFLRGGRQQCGTAGTAATSAIGVAGQVSAIPNSTTFSLTSRRSTPVTVTVSATTAYTEAGQTASQGDIQVGSRILACGTGTTANVQASQVYIIPDLAIGVVTKITGSSPNETLTLTGFDNTPYTVTVSGSTTYRKASQSASLADVTDGTAISVQGTRQSDGTLSARVVQIQTPRVAGQVTNVTASGSGGLTISLSGTRGVSPVSTIVTSSTTTYRVISATATAPVTGTAPTADIVKTGSFVEAQGTLSSDGKTLTASQIVVLPAGARGNGFTGRRGGFSHRGRPGAGGWSFGGSTVGPRGGFGGPQGQGQGQGTIINGRPDAPGRGFVWRSTGGWNGGSGNGGAPATGTAPVASNA